MITLPHGLHAWSNSKVPCWFAIESLRIVEIAIFASNLSLPISCYYVVCPDELLAIRLLDPIYIGPLPLFSTHSLVFLHLDHLDFELKTFDGLQTPIFEGLRFLPPLLLPCSDGTWFGH